MRVCTIVSCERKHYGRGWCRLHYDRWLNNGDPEAVQVDRNPPATCTLPGCERPHAWKGMCRPHYHRNREHGDPHAGRPLVRPSLRARFDEKVERGDGCWTWTGYIDGDGYGRFRIGDRPCLAHRVAYELEHGDGSAEGLDVDHLCFTRSCVRPDHLEAVTHAENMNRMNARKVSAP